MQKVGGAKIESTIQPLIERDGSESVSMMQQWKPVYDRSTRNPATIQHSKYFKGDVMKIVETAGVCGIILQLRIPKVKQATQMTGVCDVILTSSMTEVCSNRLLLAVKIIIAMCLSSGSDDRVNAKMVGVYLQVNVEMAKEEDTPVMGKCTLLGLRTATGKYVDPFETRSEDRLSKITARMVVAC